MQTRTVREYETLSLPSVEWSQDDAARFARMQHERFEVQAPNLFNGYQWQVKPEGYIGRVALSADLSLAIEPKVSIESVFRMLEYAYNEGRFFDESIQVGSIGELLQSLAIVLARRVAERARRGLARAYDPRHETRPLVRGRVDVPNQMRRPWRVAVPCDYQEHTPEILENEALAYTLRLILRSGICEEAARHTVRHGYQGVHALLPGRSLRGADLASILYTRLNADYQPMHALCRFFLDHLGAEHQAGQRDMLPFLIDMPRLFELFVARWLKQNLHDGWQVQEQESLEIAREEQGAALRFRADVVIRRYGSTRPWCVLDTKYKVTDKIVETDLHQVVSYATAYGADQAVLVYPEPPPVALVHVGGITVRFLAFDLAREIESAGKAFKRALLGHGPAGDSTTALVGHRRPAAHPHPWRTP